MITKTQVERWDTTHLAYAGQYFNRVAELSMDTFEDVHRAAKAPGGTAFTGLTASALVDRTRANSFEADNFSTHLRSAAHHALGGEIQLEDARHLAVQALSDASANQFDIHDDLTGFTDRTPGTTAWEKESRQRQGEIHLAAVHSAVSDLVTTDQRVSANLAQSMLGIHGMDFKMGGGCDDARQRAQDQMEDNAMWAVIGAVVGGIVSGGNPLAIAGGAAVAGGIPILRGAIDPPQLPECEQ